MRQPGGLRVGGVGRVTLGGEGHGQLVQYRLQSWIISYHGLVEHRVRDRLTGSRFLTAARIGLASLGGGLDRVA